MAGEYSFLTDPLDSVYEGRMAVHMQISGYSVGGKDDDKGVLERKLLLRSLKDTNSSRVKWEDCLRKLNDLTVADGAPTELKARAMADGKAAWAILSKTQKYLNLHFERSAQTAFAWSSKDSYMALSEQEKKEMREIEKDIANRKRLDRVTSDVEQSFRKRSRFESDSNFGGGNYYGGSQGYPSEQGFVTQGGNFYGHGGQAVGRRSGFRNSRPRFPPSVNGCNNCYKLGHWEKACTNPRAPDSSFPYHLLGHY